MGDPVSLNGNPVSRKKGPVQSCPERGKYFGIGLFSGNWVPFWKPGPSPFRKQGQILGPGYLSLLQGCVLSKFLRYIPDSSLSRFPLGISVCTQWQVKHQRWSRTCRVQKNHNILRKNTIFNEHPVTPTPQMQIKDFYGLWTA